MVPWGGCGQGGAALSVSLQDQASLGSCLQRLSCRTGARNTLSPLPPTPLLFHLVRLDGGSSECLTLPDSA